MRRAKIPSYQIIAQHLLTPSCRFHAEIAFPGENTPSTSCETRRLLFYQEMRVLFSFHLLQESNTSAPNLIFRSFQENSRLSGNSLHYSFHVPPEIGDSLPL
ncbi:hypothetical protein CDAR_375011 [Caerostris darwini]|uniref:Uncharacterized protein n=1 Tax=Caerostris darwini TaxID=1538125 RepID=A0AAV4RJ02_9ARAC|nr:hypothetical protein CDAR_375011 [Caerostris darwini]